MKPFLKITFVVLLFSVCFKSNAQIGVTSYGINALGINTNTSKKLYGEIKTFANTDYDNLAFEPNVFYNLKGGEYHNFAIGLGVLINPFFDFDHVRALSIPLALNVRPLKDFQRISVLYELTPQIGVDGDNNLRHLWGIRYTLGKK